jgi:hypothetical protein
MLLTLQYGTICHCYSAMTTFTARGTYVVATRCANEQQAKAALTLRESKRNHRQVNPNQETLDSSSVPETPYDSGIVEGR